MSSSSLPAFRPTCPLGGTWYACGTGTFFTGCCTRDPCQVTCAQGDLYPAGFDPAYHSKFPDASCGSGVNFFTCTAGNTFMGCCKVNPCNTNGVCSNGNLEPAFVNRDDLRSAYGATGGSSSVGSLRPTSTSGIATSLASDISSTTSSTTIAATATGDTVTATATPKDGPPVAAIAGGAAGGTLALVAVVGLLIYYFCHAKRSRKGQEESAIRPDSNIPPMIDIPDKDKAFSSPGPPPSYRSPNPNGYYSPHAGQYQAYAPQHQEQELHELPIDPLYRGPMPNHRRNISELSGDAIVRSELESPLMSPHGQTTSVTPTSSPQLGSHSAWQSPLDGRSEQQWTPHQSWQAPSQTSYSHGRPQGLGLEGDVLHSASGPA